MNIVQIDEATGNVIVTDGNGTDIPLTSNGSPNAPNASLGGYLAVLNYTPTGVPTSSSFSYVDIPGLVDQAFTTSVAGPHLFNLSAYIFATGGTLDYRLRLVIDGSTFLEFPVRETNSAGDATVHFNSITLAAGTHTVRPQWKEVAGPGGPGSMTANVAQPWNLSIQAQGSGINGLSVQEYTMTANFPVTQAYSDTPGGNMAQVDSVQLTITALQNEVVEVTFDGSFGDGATSDLIIGYQIDSNTPVVATYGSPVSSLSTNISFSLFTTPLTAGIHTIKLMASKGVGSPVINGGVNFSPGRFQVVRYRGGSIYGNPVDADLIPDITNAHDIGSGSLRFKDGYFAGVLTSVSLALSGNATVAGAINTTGAPLVLSNNDQGVTIGSGTSTSILESKIQTAATGTPKQSLTKGTNNWSMEHLNGGLYALKYNNALRMTLSATGDVEVVGDMIVDGDMTVSGNLTASISATAPRSVVDIVMAADTLLDPGASDTDVAYRILNSGGTNDVGVANGSFDGQIVTIYGAVGTANTASLQDVTIGGAGGAIKNLAGSFNVNQNDTIQLVWDASASMWNELGRSNN